jgi:hypothetical protein
MTSTRSLTSKEIDSVDIEETLVKACVSLNKTGDQRLLSLLLSWVSIHGGSVIIEKLTKILLRRQILGDNVEFVALIAKFAEKSGFKRWKILANFAPRIPLVVGPFELAQSLIDMRGEEDWSKDSGFIIPKKTISIDSKWILARNALAQINHQYKNRLVYGPQWRADIITAIELGAKTPTEVSKMCGASYEPCHRVMSELKDAGILNGKEKAVRRVI